MLKEKINKLLIGSLSEADIKISTDDDKHFNITIVSDVFENKSLVERQKIVYDVLSSYILSGELHAVSLKTCTKAELLNINNS